MNIANKRDTDAPGHLRILYVSYRFPPQATAESIQSFKFAIGLSELGHEIKVLTVRPGDSRSPLDSDLELLRRESGLDVTETRSYVPGRLARGVLRRIAPAAVDAPDEHAFWVEGAVRRGREMCFEFKPDVVYSRAQSFISHVVSAKVASAADLPLVAHFSDPWVDNPFRSWTSASRARNGRLERKVLESACSVVFVSERTRDLVMGKYRPEISSKGVVIPHAYVPEWYPKPQERAADSRLCFRHIGSLYGLRGVGQLVAGLDDLASRTPELLESVRFEFIGHTGPEASAALRPYVELGVAVIRPPVTYLESLELACSADVLVLFDALVDGRALFLPSKVVDYLPTRRPILAFTDSSGLTAEVVRAADGIVVGEGTATETAMIVAELAGHVHDTRQREGGVLGQFELSEVSRRLSTILTASVEHHGLYASGEKRGTALGAPVGNGE